MGKRIRRLRGNNRERMNEAVRVIVIGTLLLLFCTVAALAQGPTPTGQVLYSFCTAGLPCADGIYPPSGLAQAPDGSLWGETNAGGANSYGTIFKVTKSGTLTTVYAFCSQSGCADGALPQAGLTLGSDGNFYGITDEGGAINAAGNVFRIAPDGTYANLYTFCNYTVTGSPGCVDGSQPEASVILGADGNVYGTTQAGGQYGGGVVFQLVPPGTPGNSGTTWAENVLYNFCHQTSCPEGSQPQGGLVQDKSGNLYGTAFSGGAANNSGTVFKLSPPATSGGAWQFTILHTFCTGSSTCPDGAQPLGPLVLVNGTLFGTTYHGGAGAYESGSGAIFQIDSSGTFSTLYSFCNTTDCGDGLLPVGLKLGSDGNLYGATQEGGTLGTNNDIGTVFRITQSGTFTSLYSFGSCTKTPCGNDPLGPPILANDGNLYGATSEGGSTAHQQNGYGTVYTILLPIPVPNVVGLARATAESEITGAGLAVGVITLHTSPTVAAGDVIGENPPAGTPVSSGTAVNLVVSSGVGQATSLAIGFNPDPGTAGASETVTATITASTATVGGTVSFTSSFNNTLSTLCAQAAVAKVAGTWQANCSFTPAGSGTYAIEASYSGDQANAASTNSANLTVNVGNTPVLDYIADSGAVAINANNASGLPYNAVLNSDSSVSLLASGILLPGRGCAAYSGLTGSVGKGSVFVDAANSRIYLAMFIYDVGLYLSYESIDNQGNCTAGPLLKLNAQSLGQPAIEMNVDPAQGLMYVLVGYGGGIQDTLFVVPTAPWSASSLPVPVQLNLDYSAQYGPIVVDPSNHQVYIDDLGNAGTGQQGNSATAGFFVYDPNQSATPANNLEHVAGFISGGITTPFNVVALLDNGAGKLILANENPNASTANLAVPVTVLDTTQFSFFLNTQPGTLSGTVNITPGNGLSTISAGSQYSAISAADLDAAKNDLYAFAYTGTQGELLKYNLAPGATSPETVLDSSVGFATLYTTTAPWTQLNYDPKSTEIGLSANAYGAAALAVTSPLCASPVTVTDLVGSDAYPIALSSPVVNDTSGYLYAIGAPGQNQSPGIVYVPPPTQGCASAATYTVGGNVSGLDSGAAVVLLDNGGDALTVSQNGPFTFNTALASGSGYDVTVGTQPTGESCTVANGTGTVGTSDVTNVAVTCVSAIQISPSALGPGIVGGSYSQQLTATGGTGTGFAWVVESGTALSATGLSLSPSGLISGTPTLAESAASVTVKVTDSGGNTGSKNYQVTIYPLLAITTTTLPAATVGTAYNQQLMASGGSGSYSWSITAGASSLTNLGLNLSTAGLIGGSPSTSGQASFTVRVADTAGNSTTQLLSLTVNSASGTTIEINDPEIVTVNDSDTQVLLAVASDPENIAVTDSAVVTVGPDYTIGGKVSGLNQGASVTLLDNGVDSLKVAANGSFTFPTSLARGSTYKVTVSAQPNGQTCAVQNGAGTASSGDITNISVICTAIAPLVTPSVVLTSSANPAILAQPVSFTATVSSSSGTPTGSIAFYDGATEIGSGNLASGMASYSTSSLSPGAHSITALYSGDLNFAPAVSAALGQTVVPFILALAPGSPTSGTGVPGGFVTYQLTVIPPANSAVTFTVTGLPAGFTATFNPSTVPAGAGPTAVTLTIHIPSQVASAARVPGRPGSSNRLPLALGLVLLPLFGVARRARRMRRLRVVVVLAAAGIVAAAALNGCSHPFSSFPSNNNPPPPGSYTLTVTGSAGSVTQSTDVTLTVQ